MKIITPNDVEKEVQERFIQTGLVDLIIGIYFISISFIFDVNQYIKMGVIFGVIILYNFLKIKLVEPRIGKYKLSVRRSNIFKMQNIVIAACTLIVLIVIILSSYNLLIINEVIFKLSASIFIFLLT